MPKKRKQPRKPAKPTVEQRNRRRGMEYGIVVSPAARSTIEMLATNYLSMDTAAVPHCAGPLLVHEDGAFECHGPDCPGGMVAFHDADAVEPCRNAGALEVDVNHACPSCAQYASGEVLQLLDSSCSGIEIEHQDGETSCSLGADCVGPDAFHASGQSCGMFVPCQRCGTERALIN